MTVLERVVALRSSGGWDGERHGTAAERGAGTPLAVPAPTPSQGGHEAAVKNPVLSAGQARVTDTGTVMPAERAAAAYVPPTLPPPDPRPIGHSRGNAVFALAQLLRLIERGDVGGPHWQSAVRTARVAVWTARRRQALTTGTPHDRHERQLRRALALPSIEGRR